MTQIRERKLVMLGTVCEDAHSFQDPNVVTAEDARAKGRQRCPIFEACVYGNELDRRKIRCAAIFGQKVARYALEDRHSVEVEIEEFRKDAFSSGNNVGTYPFIDPYKDAQTKITDHVEATAAVEGWANMILYGPRPETEAQP